MRRPLKTVAVLGLALSIPAFIAPATISALQPAPVPEEITPMPFEAAGDNFPGSAFYYLEEAPRMVAVEGYRPVEVIGQPAIAPAAIGKASLATPVLRIAGSDRDRVRAQQCMTQAIYYEAASESQSGQRAVAQVVLNRVAHPAYPRSVCGVVFQGSERATGCQFTFTCDGSLARRPSQVAWNRASRIAREALAGVVYAPVGTATHYHTLAVNPYWASSLDTVGVIGAHIFYRWKGQAGEVSAFRAAYAGGEPTPSRARAVTPTAPDPVDAPVMAEIAAPESETPKTAQAAPSQGETPSIPSLPRSGAVRPEYANSGRWIDRD